MLTTNGGLELMRNWRSLKVKLNNFRYIRSQLENVKLLEYQATTYVSSNSCLPIYHVLLADTQRADNLWRPLKHDSNALNLPFMLAIKNKLTHALDPRYTMKSFSDVWLQLRRRQQSWHDGNVMATTALQHSENTHNTGDWAFASLGMRESFWDISPCPRVAQAGTAAHGSKQQTVYVGWWSPSAVGHHTILHSNTQCSQFSLPLPTQTAGLSRMAPSSCTVRYGIAGTVYKPMLISEGPAEKTAKNLPYPTQPPSPPTP